MKGVSLLAGQLEGDETGEIQSQVVCWTRVQLSYLAHVEPFHL